MPINLVQALRKCLACSKAWKPTTSAPTTPSSNFGPFAKAQNNWAVGNGACKKKTILAFRDWCLSTLKGSEVASNDGRSIR